MAVTITIYHSKKSFDGVKPSIPSFVEEEPQPVINPPDSLVPTYISLADTKDATYVGKNGFIPVVTAENGLTLMPIQNSEKDGLISGGVVQWTGSGYDFNVATALARFQGVYPLNSDAAVISLTTPDATNDRIDLFILQILFDGNGIPNGMEADFITGTPAGSPVKPQIDPATQIELTQVTVTAASSTPTLTEEVIYDENIEWTGSSSGTGTVAFNSASNPFQGSLSIEATNIQNGLKIRLTDGSDYDLSGVQTLGMQLDLKAQMFAGQNIGVSFLDSTGAAISSELVLSFDKISTDYQFIGIALSQFSFTSLLARSIEFRYIRTKGATVHAGFFLDIIKLEGGINPPITTGSFLDLSDTPSSYIGQASKVVAVKADETGLEFITGGGGGITGSGTANEIAYFTGATAIGALSVMTYPSLAELAYVKGLTSPAQTQLNGKQATIAGTLTNGYVATVVAGVPTWAAPAGGSSNWTVVGSDIYRDSRVIVGRTTLPTDSTFSVQSKESGIVGKKFVQFLDRSGVEMASFNELGGAAFSGDTFNFGTPTSPLTVGWTIKLNGSSGTKMIRIDNGANTELFSMTNQGKPSFYSTLFELGTPVSPLTVGITWKVQGSGGATKIWRIDNAANTEIFSMLNGGTITLGAAANIVLGTTTGTKIGTATTQKLAFWNKTPIIQPTNAITAAAFVANTSGIANDTATYGGYTMGQIAAALINIGALA